ncbi:O-antigen ligase family protein [Neobacillus sp. Marseille-QA0830]
MYWFILLFPLLIYPWGFDPYYTDPKTNYLYLFVIGTWLYVLFKRKFRSLFPSQEHNMAVYTLFVFICLVEISTAFSDYRYTSVYGLIDRKEGLISFFSYCSVFLFSFRFLGEKKWDKAISGIAIVSIIVSIYGILQHFQLDFLPRNSAMRHYPGTYTFFDNPNFFGSYLVLAFLSAVTCFIISKSKKTTMLYYITVCFAFVALIFSNTRSAYVGVFCALVFLKVFVIFKRKFLWKKWGSLMVSLMLLLLIINWTENGRYNDRIGSVLSDSYKIASHHSTGHEGSSRFFIWKKSLPLIPEYFWIGSGPDTFEFIFPATDKELLTYLGGQRVDKAHNEYLQMAITLGVPALLTYLLFIFLILRKAFLAVRMASGKERLMMYGLISIVIGYLIQAFFNISTVPVAPLYWAILGITLAKSEWLMKSAASEQLNLPDHGKNQIA